MSSNAKGTVTARAVDAGDGVEFHAMRSLVALVVLTAATVVAVPSAGAGDALVRPGKGIGRVSLGMTSAQLQRAMGKPTYVVVKASAFGRRVTEHQYGLSSEWTVTLAGPRMRLRVTAVATALRRERTREGFGVGSSERRVIAGYGQRLRCEPWVRTNLQGLVVLKNTIRECVLGARGAPETVFVARIFPKSAYEIITPEDIPRARVIEVAVRLPR